MKKTLTLIGLAFTLALFAGCATPVSQEQIQQEAERMGYGAAPEETIWQAGVVQFMELRLKDPASAQYKFGSPVKSHLTHPPIKGGGLKAAGYEVDVMVNARNSYGGYTGYEAYKFFIRDNKVVAHATQLGNNWFWQWR